MSCYVKVNTHGGGKSFPPFHLPLQLELKKDCWVLSVLSDPRTGTLTLDLHGRGNQSGIQQEWFHSGRRRGDSQEM